MNSVDVDRTSRVVFVNWKILGNAVNLSRACEDHRYVRICAPDILKQVQLCAAIDVEVHLWISHRIPMIPLTGQIEDELGRPEHIRDRIAIAQVFKRNINAVGKPFDIEKRSAVGGEKAIEEMNACPSSTQYSR
jgi:hypothetical protein